MKFGISLAAAALMLAGVNAAQAQLTITLDAPVTLPSGALQYGGTISNPTNSPIEVDGAGLNTTGGIQYFDALEGSYSSGYSNPILSALPLTVNANDFYGDNDLFELIVPANTPLTDLTFTVSNATTGIVGSADFTVGTADVPEPGSVALLASGVVSGSVLLARRRRRK